MCYSTECYTDGALSSDDDIAVLCSAKDKERITDTGPPSGSTAETATEQTISPSTHIVPSSGYSAIDYQPLALTQQQSTASPTIYELDVMIETQRTSLS